MTATATCTVVLVRPWGPGSQQRVGCRGHRQWGLRQRVKDKTVSPSPREQSCRGALVYSGGTFHLPAVDHDGPGFGWVQELDLADEAQEASGITGDAMVGPAGEVEEAQLPDLMIAFLRKEGAPVPPAAVPTYPTRHPQRNRLPAQGHVKGGFECVCWRPCRGH